MRDADRWLTAESLRAQEAREVGEVEAGTFDGRGDFGSYYAFARGLNSEHIKWHALADDRDASAYAGLLATVLAEQGLSLRGKVLDVGCAVGSVTNALAQLNPGGETWGVDISRHAIAFAKTRYLGCTFLERAADRLEDFEDDSLDVIHAREFYPFTRTNDPEVPLEFLGLFSRKLRKDGRILLQMRSSDVGFPALLPQIETRLRAANLQAALPVILPPLRAARVARGRALWRLMFKLINGPARAIAVGAGRSVNLLYVLSRRA